MASNSKSTSTELHNLILENCDKVSLYDFSNLDSEYVTKLTGSKMQVKTSEHNGEGYLFNI
jgi:hypothetical protein